MGETGHTSHNDYALSEHYDKKKKRFNSKLKCKVKLIKGSIILETCMYSVISMVKKCTSSLMSTRVDLDVQRKLTKCMFETANSRCEWFDHRKH